MRGRGAGAVAALWGACVPARTTPPSICEQRPDVPCVGSVPFAGGGSGAGLNPADGGTDGGRDGGRDGGLFTLAGRLVAAQTIPWGAIALRPAVGWQLAASPTGFQTLGVTTDESGNFGLSDVAFTAGTTVVRATPPVANAALGMLTVVARTTAAVTLVVVGRDALETAAIGAGYVPAPGFAHVVLQLIDPAGDASGVSLVAMDVFGNVAYDDSQVGLTAVGPTGRQGVIAVFNLTAAPDGGTVDFQLQRQGRTAAYRAPVAPDFVTWLPVAPP